MQPSSEQKKYFSCGIARFFTCIIGTFISVTLFHVPDQDKVPTLECSAASENIKANFVPIKPRRAEYAKTSQKHQDNVVYIPVLELCPGQEHETCSKEWICLFQFRRRISIVSHLPCHTERCWQSSQHPISLAFWWKTKEVCTTLLLLQGHLQMILLPPAFEIPTLYRGLNSNGWPYGIWPLQLSDRKISSLLGDLKIHSA